MKSMKHRAECVRFESLETRQMMSVYLSLNGPQTISPEPTTNASTDNSFGQSGMVIDINPTNPLNLVGISQRIGGQNAIDVFHSHDAGKHWTRTVISDGSVGYNDGTGAGTRFDPAIAFDDAGNLFVAYGNDKGTSTSAIVGRSTDGGASFSQFRTLANTTDVFNGTAGEIRGNAQFALASGPDGLGGRALYVTYINSAIETGNGLDRRIMITGSNDAGGTFLAPTIVNNVSISAGDYSNYSPDVAVGAAGQVFVVWHNVNIDTGSERILTDRDMDGRFLTSSNFGLDGTVKSFANGSLYGWPLPAAPDHGVFTNPTIDVDRSTGPNSGRVYISYCDWMGGNNTDIKVARSLTGAGSWTEFTLDASPGTDFQPQISVDPHSGAVAVGYYSTKNDASGDDDVQPFLGLSIDGGSSYTSSAISSQTSNETGGNSGDYGDHIGLAVRDGTAHVLWSSRHGVGTDLDAFTSTVGFVSTSNGNALTVNERGFMQTAVDSGALDAFQYVWAGQSINPPIIFGGLKTVLDSIVLNADAGAVIVVASLPDNVNVTVNGSSAPDTIMVKSLPSLNDLTITGGGGNDVIDIGEFGTLAGVQGHITVNNDAGSDRLYLDDSNGANANVFTITDTNIIGSGFGGITYSGLLSYLSLKMGTLANTINVTATNYNLQFDLDAGAGNDVINIGTILSLGAIRAPINIADSAGYDTININDLPLVQQIGGTHYRLTATSLARSNFPGLTWGHAGAINLYAAGDSDWIDIDGTTAGTAYNLTCNGRTSQISVNETNPAAPIAISSVDQVDWVSVNSNGLGHARAVFATTQRIGVVSVGDGGTAIIGSGGNKVLTTTILELAPQGELDLTDNDFILDYSGSPGPALASIQALINEARNGGAWNGAGITSSFAASNVQRTTGLGSIEATSYKSVYGNSAKFNGQVLDNSAVLVKYTYYGDTDFNGKVDGADYARLDAKFNQQASQGNIGGWFNGDCDGNGKIDGSDYALIDAAFNSQNTVLRSGRGLMRA